MNRQPPSSVLNTIALGQVYEYVGALPRDCAGELYQPHRLVLDVPVYNWKVLVEALTGKDRGLWFVCSVNNFSRRYRLYHPGQGEQKQQENGAVEKELSSLELLHD